MNLQIKYQLVTTNLSNAISSFTLYQLSGAVIDGIKYWIQIFTHTHTHNKQSLLLFQLGDDSLLFYFRLLQNKPLQQKSIPNNSKCLSLDFFTKRWKARTLNKALIKLDKRSEFIVLFKKSLSGLVGNTVRLMKWRLFQFSG